MEKLTATCDACGTRYAFTSHKDRCPVCCPKVEPEAIDYDQTMPTDSDGIN